MKPVLPGINIQYPISSLILSGEKTVETRTYRIPEQYIGKQLAIIETPGGIGKFEARVVGLVVFGQSFKYSSKTEFAADYHRHRVDDVSIWRWCEGIEKWGWPILDVVVFNKPSPGPAKKGIRFTKSVELNF